MLHFYFCFLFFLRDLFFLCYICHLSCIIFVIMSDSDEIEDCPTYRGVIWSPAVIEQSFRGTPCLRFPNEEAQTLFGFDLQFAYQFYVELMNKCYNVSWRLHELIAERCQIQVAIRGLEVVTGYSLDRGVRNRIRALKELCRTTMGEIVDLQHRYMELESDSWHR